MDMRCIEQDFARCKIKPAADSPLDTIGLRPVKETEVKPHDENIFITFFEIERSNEKVIVHTRAAVIKITRGESHHPRPQGRGYL